MLADGATPAFWVLCLSDDERLEICDNFDKW
jgi:hypothetical protein